MVFNIVAKKKRLFSSFVVFRIFLGIFSFIIYQRFMEKFRCYFSLTFFQKFQYSGQLSL